MTEATTGREIDPDGVSHPIHYNTHPSGIECIDLIRGLNFNIGSAVKYVMRRGQKGDALKDLNKALYYLVDYLFDGSERRLEKPPFGEIKSRWQWDQVAAFEPDLRARQFYLAVVRQDPLAAKYAVEDLISELEPAPTPEVTEDHPFEAYEGSSGFACTAMLLDEDGATATDCGKPPEVHPRG